MISIYLINVKLPFHEIQQKHVVLTTFKQREQQSQLVMSMVRRLEVVIAQIRHTTTLLLWMTNTKVDERHLDLLVTEKNVQ